jgi:hypothetical protein
MSFLGLGFDAMSCSVSGHFQGLGFQGNRDVLTNALSTSLFCSKT